MPINPGPTLILVKMPFTIAFLISAYGHGLRLWVRKIRVSAPVESYECKERPITLLLAVYRYY